jgi:hypothetical protein
MDVELWCYLIRRGARWRFIPQNLSTSELSAINKTSVGGPKYASELEQVFVEHAGGHPPLTFWYRRLIYPLDRWRGRRPNLLRRGVMVLVKGTFSLVFGPFYGFRRALWMTWV